jgi:hypothetical protein
VGRIVVVSCSIIAWLEFFWSIRPCIRLATGADRGRGVTSCSDAADTCCLHAYAERNGIIIIVVRGLALRVQGRCCGCGCGCDRGPAWPESDGGGNDETKKKKEEEQAGLRVDHVRFSLAFLPPHQR